MLRAANLRLKTPLIILSLSESGIIAEMSLNHTPAPASNPMRAGKTKGRTLVEARVPVVFLSV